MRSLIRRLSQVFPQSLISEISRIFGEENTEKLITIFAGTTIYVPSTKDLEEQVRNLSIYDSIKQAKSNQEKRRLRVVLKERYHLSTKELKKIYRKTSKLLKEAAKYKETDSLTGQHLPKKHKIRRKNKRRM